MLIDRKHEALGPHANGALSEDQPQQTLKMGDVGATDSVDRHSGHEPTGGSHQCGTQSRNSGTEQEPQHPLKPDEISLELAGTYADADVHGAVTLGDDSKIEERGYLLAGGLHRPVQ